MVYKSCWLILYGGGDNVGVEGGGSVGGQEVKTGIVKEAVLLSLLLSYSDDNISVCDSRPSSCLAYMSY